MNRMRKPSLVRLGCLTISLLLWIGCHSVDRSIEHRARIADGLETQVTPEEARRFFFDWIDQDIRELQVMATTNEVARLELETLSGERQKLQSNFDSFLVRSRPGAELWTYRAMTPPCVETGVASVRKGEVVDHVPLLTRYVGY